MTIPESNSSARSPQSELGRQRRRLLLVRTRLLFRMLVGAEALTTWGSVTLLSVAAGGLGTCVSTARGFEIGQSLLIGLAALVSVGVVTLTCAGFVDSERLCARKRQLEGAIADILPAAIEERRAIAEERLLHEKATREADRAAWEAEQPARKAAIEEEREATSPLTACKACGGQVSRTAPTCPHCGETMPGITQGCPNCGSKKIATGQKGFGLGRAVGFGFLFGPVGLLAGLKDKDKPMLVCQKCNHKWQS